MAEKLSLVFDGKLATSGELHFYEYSRAAYGFARFVSTIESFRRTGRVPKRIVQAANIDLLIKAPRQGSFPIDIIAPVATALGTELAGLPLKILMEYVMQQVQRLLPGQENALLRAAEIQLEVEKQRTTQLISRDDAETARLELIQKMFADQNVTTRASLSLIEQAQKTNSIALDTLREQGGEIVDLRDRLALIEKREASFQEYLPEIESVDDNLMLKLSSKVRPQIAEMALPLRKSASTMALTAGDERVVSARLNRAEAQDINSRHLDAESMRQKIRLAAYDRDTGVGKLDLLESDLKRLSFSVPPGARTRLRSKIASAIDQEEVHASFRLFRNQSGEITSAVLDEIPEAVAAADGPEEDPGRSE
ncbi:DUF7946 domain-containing protein [Mangrovibrevibacter kandeliae]|uniref:DUF7946 domain-containing protein n=1 Tax=Mangrovibrevibacter kandeliae TaxID=2968473 RepID=UPI002117D858|nr:hypothetical protein [Aurantimonas sp. CSK15Z-1]MCQ8781659.1 hypothetical protein [Aurantimonas sp. CSK15Z-1]